MEKNNKDKNQQSSYFKHIIKKHKSKIKYIVLIIGVLILANFIFMQVVKNNEDLESKIIGKKHAVNWSDTSLDVENSKDFEDFKSVLNENGKKFDKTIVILNQFNGCGSCIDTLLESINKNSKDFDKNKLGIVLVTTLDKEYIETVYKDEYKFVNIISDSEFQISKNIDMYNDEENQMENCILVIEDNNIESYVDEYYYEDDEEVINYVLSYIKNK